MNKFSVLLLYPDYAAHEFGHDTFLAHVEAVDAANAEKYARNKASRENHMDIEPEDWSCLLVTVGHIEDIRSGGP